MENIYEKLPFQYLCEGDLAEIGWRIDLCYIINFIFFYLCAAFENILTIFSNQILQ